MAISYPEQQDTSEIESHLKVELEIGDKEKFQNWILSSETFFDSLGDPIEISDNKVLKLTDNYCEAGIKDSNVYLTQVGKNYNSDTSNISQDEQKCIDNGGTWYEPNICDNPNYPASSTQTSSTPAVSSSQSSSTQSTVDNSEDKQKCIDNGGTWYEPNICDGQELDDEEIQTFDIDNILNNSYTIKGYFTSIESKWIYSTPQGFLIAEISGKKDNGEIKWNILYQGDESHSTYSHTNKNISFSDKISDITIAGKSVDIQEYVIRYEDSRYGWIFIGKDKSVKHLKGITDEGKLDFEPLNDITPEFTENGLGIRFK
jgi:hypothetical protein